MTTAGAGVVGMAALSFALAMGKGRDAIAAAVVVLLTGIAARAPRIAIGVTLVYLAVLGDVRRALIGLVGWQPRDPLLLVGPILALLLAVPALLSRNRPRSRLQVLVTALLILMALQMFNPRQGGLAVGVAGALFYVVPLLWFFAGRAYGDSRTLQTVIFRLVPAIAVPAAMLGVYQAFFGWLPFEKRWLSLAGYAALHVGSRLRPISFFTSSSEYEVFVVAAAVTTAALGLRHRRTWFLLALPLAAAGFLAGSRTVMVMGTFTIALLWASLARRRGFWWPRFAVALAIVVGGGYWALTQVSSVNAGPATSFVEHQTQGLLHPLNNKTSTATEHVGLVMRGLYRGLRNPLGDGLGSTTLAANRFGGINYSTEVDLTNVVVSLGVLGGVMYLVVIVMVVLAAARHWWRARSVLALAVLGLLVVTLGNWLSGGQYALGALIWFTIGAQDRIVQGQKP